MQLVLELAGVLFFKSSKFAHADAQRNSHTAQRRPPTMGGKPPRQHTSLLVTGLALSVALVAYVSLPEDDAPPPPPKSKRLKEGPVTVYGAAGGNKNSKLVATKAYRFLSETCAYKVMGAGSPEADGEYKHCGFEYNLAKFCKPGFTLAVNAKMRTWCACRTGTQHCYCAKVDTITAKPPLYLESVTTDSTSRKPELQMEAPRVVALSEEATCENKDERPSEMSWDVLQRSALSSAMSWGFEYFKNNYVPTEYKEELAKQAFAQTVIREDNARQAARRAKRKGGARE